MGALWGKLVNMSMNDNRMHQHDKEEEDDDDDLPPIRYINFNDLRKLSSFPRYPENADICVNEDDIDRSISLIIFISHCWLRGWDGAAGWDGRPHPDNSNHDKFALILEAIDKYLIKQAPGMKEVYVWIDYGCINQNADPAGELKQLDKIVQSSDLVLTVIADSYDNEWESWDVHVPSSVSSWFKEYKAKAWNDGQYAYVNRCWCRVEMMYAANVPLSKDTADRSKHFSAGLLEAVRANRRPHYLYGTREKMTIRPPTSLEPLRNTFFEEYNPLTGSITKESDRDKIKELTKALQPYIDANKATEGYVGERNAAGKMNGRGTLTLASGDVYVGEFKDDKMNGHGTYTYANCDVYVGEYKDDKMNGHGTYTSASGSVFVGEYRDDKMHGHGTYTLASGDVYVGEFKDDNSHGHGTLTYPSGDVYVGEFEDHNMNGHGTYTYASGDVYVGEFKDDKMSGHGTYTLADGDVYVGEFEDDKMHGHGTYTSATGDVYVGEFKDIEMHGHGTYTYASGDVYVGEFKDDNKHGHGTYTHADGDVYVGEFKYDNKHGHGILTYADDSEFVGEFKHDIYSYGTLTYADGSLYVGELKDDKRNGHGTYTYADGRVLTGTFKDDEFSG